MKKIKRLHILIEWLMVICMISVGYSAWAITVPSETSASGSINAYPVIKADDYVTIGDVRMFDYNEYGFINGVSVNSDGSGALGDSGLQLSNKGTITVPLNFQAACFNDADKTLTLEMHFSFVNTQNSQADLTFINACDVTIKADGVPGTYFLTSVSGNWSCNEKDNGLFVSKEIKLGSTVPADHASFNLLLEFTVKEDENQTLGTILSNSLGGKKLSIKTVVKGYSAS